MVPRSRATSCGFSARNCRARSAFSAPSRKRSRQSSTSDTFNPCHRAASAAVVSPLSRLIIVSHDAWRSSVGPLRIVVRRPFATSMVIFDLVLLVARFPRGARYVETEHKPAIRDSSLAAGDRSGATIDTGEVMSASHRAPVMRSNPSALNF